MTTTVEMPGGTHWKTGGAFGDVTSQVPFLLLRTPKKTPKPTPSLPPLNILQLWGNFLFLPRVSPEHSAAAAAPKAAKHQKQKFAKSQSLGAAGDVEFWGRTHTVPKCDHLPCFFPEPPSSLDHQEARVVSHSPGAHLGTALSQTS